MSDVTDIATYHGGGSLQAKQRQQYETVHCLLLPLHKEIGLLPNASVAEILTYTPPEPVAEAPEWLLGNLTWRERRLPLISFELISQAEIGRMHKSCRIAVVNTINGNARLPYFGLLLQSLPSLQIVRPNTIHYTDETMPERSAIKSIVNVNGTRAIILDIDEIEARLLSLE